jgi:heme A synthase
MLRILLGLLSGFEGVLNLKRRLAAAKRQGLVAAIALVLLLLAAIFGLITAYFALTGPAGLSPVASAGIIAASLFVLAVLLFAVLPALGPKAPKPKPAAMVEAGTESLAMADKTLAKAMQQVSPITMLAVAFVAGLLASRR